jgi:hypothetical protein
VLLRLGQGRRRRGEPAVDGDRDVIDVHHSGRLVDAADELVDVLRLGHRDVDHAERDDRAGRQQVDRETLRGLRRVLDVQPAEGRVGEGRLLAAGQAPPGTRRPSTSRSPRV